MENAGQNTITEDNNLAGSDSPSPYASPEPSRREGEGGGEVAPVETKKTSETAEVAENLAGSDSPSPYEGEGGGEVAPVETNKTSETAEVADNLADSGPMAAENGATPIEDTNPEFPIAPESEIMADTGVSLPQVETPADQEPTPSATSDQPAPSLRPGSEQAQGEGANDCPPCQEKKCEELTVDSPKFKELLKIYLSGFVLVRRAKRERNLQLILDAFTPQDKITNSQVQSLLKVSQSTASAYLTVLFKQGKIMRFGTGRKTFYQKYGQM